ncbi:hypothetical protein LCGC14_2859200 [marine sediment metagenome]|uniref:Uncharacterized protein n=1 Tax=marine sediment metagenome TaxID=412755 RepID=A0A0F8Y6H9_9ZZZZ
MAGKTPHGRVTVFLDLQATMRGIDHEVLYRIGAQGEIAELLVTDLRSLVVNRAALLEAAKGAIHEFELMGGPTSVIEALRAAVAQATRP